MGIAARANVTSANAATPAAPELSDQAELERILAEHRSAIFAYFRARLLQSDDAEDLAQEVFLRWYRGQGELKKSADRAWLIGIARNVLREHVRANAKRREIAWAELCLELEDFSERPAAASLAAGHLPECLESLGHSARQAIDMHYAKGMRLAEVGEKLERTEPAVRLLMFRARQALRNCLERKMRADHAD